MISFQNGVSFFSGNRPFYLNYLLCEVLEREGQLKFIETAIPSHPHFSNLINIQHLECVCSDRVLLCYEIWFFQPIPESPKLNSKLRRPLWRLWSQNKKQKSKQLFPYTICTTPISQNESSYLCWKKIEINILVFVPIHFRVE